MITRLQGILLEKQATQAIVDLHGVAFAVLIPTSTFEAMPAVGKPATLLTYLHVREDALLLFGFASRGERQVFESMLAVSGIGPKLALAALSAMRPSEIQSHIVAGDAGFLTRIPGVGKKTAERMIVELRDRFEAMDLGGPVGDGASTPEREDLKDALAALEALGFSKSAAERTLRAVRKKHPGEHRVEDLIRFALREQ